MKTVSEQPMKEKNNNKRNSRARNLVGAKELRWKEKVSLLSRTLPYGKALGTSLSSLKLSRNNSCRENTQVSGNVSFGPLNKQCRTLLLSSLPLSF